MAPPHSPESILLSRVAVLEAQHSELVREVVALRTTDDKINAKLDVLIEAHTRYRGFLGGIVLIGSVVATCVTILGTNAKAVIARLFS